MTRVCQSTLRTGLTLNIFKIEGGVKDTGFKRQLLANALKFVFFGFFEMRKNFIKIYFLIRIMREGSSFSIFPKGTVLHPHPISEITCITNGK
jgi:hypothetical protein